MLHIPVPLQRVLVAAMMLTLLLAFAGCEHESDDIPDGPAITIPGLIEEGWEAYNSGDYDEAVNIFSEAAYADAKSLEAYLGIGYAFTQRNELVRADQNLGNVINLSTVILTEGVITEEDSIHLCAEAYAGLAAADLASGDFQSALDNAEMCLAYLPDFDHRWIGSLDAQKVRVIMAEAYYGNDEYAEAMFVIDEITGSFISGSAELNTETETSTVVLEQDTWMTGIATLNTAYSNLVYPSSVVTASGEACEVMDFVPGGASVSFRCAPIPTQGQQFTIEYMYASNFGAFLIELRDAIEAL